VALARIMYGSESVAPRNWIILSSLSQTGRGDVNNSKSWLNLRHNSEQTHNYIFFSFFCIKRTLIWIISSDRLLLAVMKMQPTQLKATQQSQMKERAKRQVVQCELSCWPVAGLLFSKTFLKCIDKPRRECP